MRSRIRHAGIYSLSAVDLFASAMGAFIIISIILMPDYQKEVRLEGHLKFIEALAGRSEAVQEKTGTAIERLLFALSSAELREQDLLTEEALLQSELDTLRSQLQASLAARPVAPAAPAEPDEPVVENLVTFRFLGLKTDQTRFLLMVDMSKYLAEHRELIERTVARALESLQPGMEFGVLGFQQLDSGPVYHHWPAAGKLAPVTTANRGDARSFVRRLGRDFAGGAPMLEAFREAHKSPAEALILISDGLPNPSYNEGQPPRVLAQAITRDNNTGQQIHTVTVGDYFKYQGTVEFMESLARANAGGFLALAQ